MVLNMKSTYMVICSIDFLTRMKALNPADRPALQITREEYDLINNAKELSSRSFVDLSKAAKDYHSYKQFAKDGDMSATETVGEDFCVISDFQLDPILFDREALVSRSRKEVEEMFGKIAKLNPIKSN